MNHAEFYAQAALYEAAFDFRDIPAQCRFLTTLAARHLERPPQRVLEIACGPASHARHLAETCEVHVLDSSEAMLSYACERAREEGIELTAHHADMRAFSLDAAPCDLALCLLDALCYLTDHQAILSHLEAVSRALTSHGLYVIECSHPRDALSPHPSTESRWSVTRGDRTLEVTFGLEEEHIDPVSQVRQTTVLLVEREGEQVVRRIEDRAPLKVTLYQELLALIALSPFELVAQYGDFDEGVALEDPEAWRMIVVLRKRA